MVWNTEKLRTGGDNTPSDLQETLSRYRRKRRALMLLLNKIDDEVERLVLQHKLRTLSNRYAPILRIDLDVCPGPVTKSSPAIYEMARTQQAPPRWKSNSIDDTLNMSQVFGNGSAEMEHGQLPIRAPESPIAPPCDGQDGSGFPATGAILSDRYELIRCVGTGGSSAVYKALDRRRLTFDDVSPYVAIKVLKARYSSLPDWLESIRREAATSQRLTHPNIIRVYDTLHEGPTVCLVMEYLSGTPLTTKIRDEKAVRLPKEYALKIIDAMGRALAYAHRRGIVHCDFKPANIFLMQDGTVKLIDFGIAQLVGAAASDPDAESETVRELHPVTPAYASPELMERQEPDPRDDVYSLACTAYELLTGAHPFDFRSALEARQLDLKVERRDGLTRQQWKALSRAMELDRSKRTPTIARFLSEFHGWAWQAQVLSKAAGAKMVSQGMAWLHNRQLDATATASLAGTAPIPNSTNPRNALPPPDHKPVPLVEPRIDPADG